MVPNPFTEAYCRYEISDHRVMWERLFGGDVHVSNSGYTSEAFEAFKVC